MFYPPRRQVHIDFHTSELIPDVAARFDPEKFADTLARAHANSVNLFAKCHHGWSYYDTKIGERHPNLSFDLLRAQSDACKKVGVAVVIYYSIGWDERAARLHPEWREIKPDGTYRGLAGENLTPAWRFMCLNSPYLDYCRDQFAELAELFPEANGYWPDIVFGNECCCENCIRSMNKAGLDWQNEEDRRQFAYQTRERYFEVVNAACRRRNPAMAVFHNSGHLPQGDRKVLEHFSHLEIESLPTGGWGYDDFPLFAAYARTLGKQYLGMTGKFHTLWGEFGGYKHVNALRFENDLMSAFGAGCCVGDQMHPSGEMDESTYALIGAVYKETMAKEPWCIDSEAIVDIGLFSAGSMLFPGETGPRTRDLAPDHGAVRMLLEGHFLFDVIDRFADFSRYKLLILPDVIRLDPELKSKLEEYRQGGGCLLLTGESGMLKGADEFGLDIGANYEGLSPFNPDYALPIPELRPEMVANPIVMYAASRRIRATSGISLGQIIDPYFNRTAKHFCSHQHTPARLTPSGYDAGVEHEGLIYLSHPLFTIYQDKGAVTTRRFVAKAIDRLLCGKRSLEVSLPSFGRATLTRQPDKRRDVVHLLCAIPISRGAFQGRPIEVVEDIALAADVQVSMPLRREVSRATLEPQGRDVPFTVSNDVLSLVVDRVAGHQMLVLYDR